MHPVLIVEDDHSMQSFVSHILVNCGLGSQVVDEGIDALSLITQKQFLMAIVDYQLPDFNGSAVAVLSDKKKIMCM